MWPLKQDVLMHTNLAPRPCLMWCFRFSLCVCGRFVVKLKDSKIKVRAKLPGVRHSGREDLDCGFSDVNNRAVHTCYCMSSAAVFNHTFYSAHCFFSWRYATNVGAWRCFHLSSICTHVYSRPVGEEQGSCCWSYLNKKKFRVRNCHSFPYFVPLIFLYF